MRTLLLAVALLLHTMPAGAQDSTRAVNRGRIVARASRLVATVYLPPLSDLSLGEAQKALDALKLRSVAVRTDGGIPAPDDIVVRQIPLPKQRVVVIATVCTLYVRPQYVQRMPRLVGRSLSDAAKLIKVAELRPNKFTTIPSPDTALGSVLQQDPPPDAPIRPDRTVDLQIAGVPQVVGLTVEAATTTLERAHLTATTTVRDSTEGSDGTVLEQSPGAGGRASPGSSVALTVVRVVGPPFEMPDLVGRPIAEAQRIVAKSGLVSQDLKVAKEEGRPDTVVAQSPTVGTLVHRRDPVTLTNGRPITTVLVPSFIGTRIDQLSQLDGATSLGIVPRFSEPTPGAKDSVVSAQSIDPGTRVRIGSTIMLTVSRRQAARLVSLRIEPDSTSIAARDSVRLTVVGVMSDGTQVSVTPSWFVSTGNITSDGRYAAEGATGRVVVTAQFAGLAATSVIRVATEPITDPRSPWWWITAITLGSAVLGWGAWRLTQPPAPPPALESPPPTPVPPPVFTYRLGARGTETEITEIHGHGSELSLVSYAGESVHVLEPTGVELFNEEKTHG